MNDISKMAAEGDIDDLIKIMLDKMFWKDDETPDVGLWKAMIREFLKRITIGNIYDNPDLLDGLK